MVVLLEENSAHKPFRAHARSEEAQASSAVSLPVNHREHGESRSAQNSRKSREEMKNGTYIIQRKKFENWKTKICAITPDISFDENNPQKVHHNSCRRWITVKEPGDTTRFKEHFRTCKVKPVLVKGTLTGMGWAEKVEKEGGAKGSAIRKAKMPCRGVTVLDNPLIDQYSNRTGAGGGGGRSICTISKERFGAEYRNLTRVQKDEVDAVQRAEWVWRNDHSRVQATNCDGFTSSGSFAASICSKCKSLLDLKVFTSAICKKIPLDDNMKYVNSQYINPTLL